MSKNQLSNLEIFFFLIFNFKGLCCQTSKTHGHKIKTCSIVSTSLQQIRQTGEEAHLRDHRALLHGSASKTQHQRKNLILGRMGISQMIRHNRKGGVKEERGEDTFTTSVIFILSPLY